MISPATEKKAMRDVFIDEALKAMGSRTDLHFLSADFGAPLLDKMKTSFPRRFINVGIAEQNLINVAAGMAFEGLTVHAYAISSFLATRAFEQVKVNLSLHSQVRNFNVNLVGVGGGLSYDISGPTHHCLEDIPIVNSLPGITLFSPSDWILVKKFHSYCLRHNSPKYLRLEGRPVPALYDKRPDVKIEDCFCELEKGKDVCIVSTGFMTHVALAAVKLARKNGLRPGLIDLFLLKPLNGRRLTKILSAYRKVITVEEGFVGKGGMDSIVLNLLNDHCPGVEMKALGFRDKYVFELGGRDYLHKLYGIDAGSIAGLVSRISGAR